MLNCVSQLKLPPGEQVFANCDFPLKWKTCSPSTVVSTCVLSRSDCSELQPSKTPVPVYVPSRRLTNVTLTLPELPASETLNTRRRLWQNVPRAGSSKQDS